MMPFGNLGARIAQESEFLETNPFAGMIIAQRKAEEAEKRRREEEEYRRVAEMAKARQTAAQLQNEANASGFPGVDASRQPPTEDPLAQVNQQLATQNPTPEDLRQRYLRQAWGMQEGQQKPTFGQRTATILMEMVRGMAQGPNYRPIAERVQEEAQKDYALQTARMGQLNAAERINALTQKTQALEQQRAYEFAQKQALEKLKLDQKMKIEEARLDWNRRKLSSQERYKEAELLLRSMNIAPDPNKVAAFASGVAAQFEKDTDGNFKIVAGDFSADNIKEYQKLLQENAKSKKAEDDKTILQYLPGRETDSEGNTKTFFQPVIKRILRGNTGTEPAPGLVDSGKFFNSPTASAPTGTPSPATIPDVPAPSTRPQGILDPATSGRVDYNQLSPAETKGLPSARTVQRELNNANTKATDLFLEWVKGGKSKDAGIGKFTQGKEVAGIDTRAVSQSDPAWWLYSKLSPAGDEKKQRLIRDYEDLENPVKQALAARLREQGGANLTQTEKNIVKEFWPERTNGPVSYFRGRTILEGMLFIENYRNTHKIKPSEERTLGPAVRDYVNDLVEKAMKNPDKVKKEDFNPSVYVPRLMAKREADARKSPSAETPRPPVVKDSGKPPTETKAVDEFNRSIKKEQEKKGWKTRSGATIRRVG